LNYSWSQKDKRDDLKMKLKKHKHKYSCIAIISTSVMSAQKKKITDLNTVGREYFKLSL